MSASAAAKQTLVIAQYHLVPRFLLPPLVDVKVLAYARAALGSTANAEMTMVVGIIFFVQQVSLLRLRSWFRAVIEGHILVG